MALMTNTLDTKDQYNSSLKNLIPDTIAYDNKLYGSIWAYIKENLWNHMDDILQKYGNDMKKITKTSPEMISEIKKMLNIDDQHPLKNRLHITGSIDRLIQQQINLYKNSLQTSWSIVEVFQQWSEEGHPLAANTVSSTDKTIIANILILMILEEELKKEKN